MSIVAQAQQRTNAAAATPPIADTTDKAAIRAAAHAYAGRGWRVVPLHRPDFDSPDSACSCGAVDCASPGKHPTIPRWQERASGARRDVDDWFAPRAPIRNLGLATGRASGLVVLDVDLDKGGPASLSQLEAQLGPLPPTPTVRTGGGGEHRYFAWDEGAGIRNSADALARGVDVRGEGGFVVAPPSLYAFQGRRYAWREGRGPDDLPVADLPRAWIDALVARSGPARSVPARRDGQAGATDDQGADKICQGGRNGALTSLAGSMRRRGMGEPAIFAALREENRARCEPPLPEAEVRAIAASVGRYQPDPDASDLDPGDLAFVDDELPDEGGAGQPPAAQAGAAPGARSYALTDAGNAERLVARFGGASATATLGGSSSSTMAGAGGPTTPARSCAWRRPPPGASSARRRARPPTTPAAPWRSGA